MNRNYGQRSIRVVFESMLERCGVLDLLLWRCDGSGAIVTEPEAPEAAGLWVRGPLMRSWIQKAARSWAATSAPRPAELFDDCWLIPIIEVQGSRPFGILMAMALGPGALGSEGFEHVCDSAKIAAPLVRQDLGSFVSARHPDPEHLATVLRWSYGDLARAEREAVALEEFSEQLVQSYEEVSLLYRLARLMNCTKSPLDTMQITCRQIHAIMPFRWVAAQFGSRDVVPGLAGRTLVAGELPCAREDFDRAVARLMSRWTAQDGTKVLEPGRNELATLLGTTVLAEPISHDGQVMGGLLAGNKCGPDRELSSIESQFFNATADFLSIFHENIARFDEQRSMFLGTLRALTASIDAKDRYTCGHSERVSLLAAKLAEALKLDEAEIETIRIAGLVHDVGKIGVPEAVLSKAGKLTNEEFEQIKRHPVIGYEILKDIPPLARMLPGVRNHHERWDGRGYPDGLAGDQVPLYGRILACADAFDAMSSTRSYRATMPRREVLAEFDRCAGSQFDPKMAGVFVGLDFSEYDSLVDEHHRAGGIAA